uniref:Protein amnionless n=1 Tax=Leptobrachium leishanense TaxID=445787 RepID=A0A8C5RB14_9ANUR
MASIGRQIFHRFCDYASSHMIAHTCTHLCVCVSVYVYAYMFICSGAGSEIHFQDLDRYQWFDPTLWHSLHPDAGSSLFCLDAELVPCQYDDVIFSPKTSFRVITKATGEAITMKSISVLGKICRRELEEDFSQHLQTNTAKLQFPGSPQMHIRNLPCEDATRCECGNAEVLQEICSALQLSKGKCPGLLCGPHTFSCHCNCLYYIFIQVKYSNCNLSISKVLKEQDGPVKNAPGSTTEIQIVVSDLLEESQTGSDAISLANDIMDDINNNGSLNKTKIFTLKQNSILCLFVIKDAC